MTAVDELRAAAARLRQMRFPVAMTATTNTAALVGARLPLADWLDATVAEMSVAEGTEYLLPGDSTDFGSWNAALAVARHINGGQP